METFPQQTESHSRHDDQWVVVSSANQLPLCFACLVEFMEDSSLTAVQKQFNLSVIADVIRCDEVSQLLREHPLVCQHILDIITDHYMDKSVLVTSVQICVQLMDTFQSEDLYVYLLDKFHHQVQRDPNVIPFVVASLGKLSMISSAYVLTLILSHEHLLMSLLETRACNEWPFEDDSSDCSLLFLLIHLFDVDILPVVPPQALPLVECCLVSCFTSAQSVDLLMNALALLKRLLNTDCCLWEYSTSWTGLLMGFKCMFVRKKVELVTATIQCLIIIASNHRHSAALHLILDSDLSEFLFESLYTLNGAQLEAVFKCLQLFAEHDLFFKKCHAVYGLESVIRSLSVALESQNDTIVVKGFNLLSTILQRQRSGVPVFVNKSAMEMTMSVVAKGARYHSLQVVLPAVSSATSLLEDSKMAIQHPAESVQAIVEAALNRVGGAVWRGEAVSVLSNHQLTEYQLLHALLDLLSAATKLPKEGRESLYTCILGECTSILCYVSDHFSSIRIDTFGSLFRLLNSLYQSHGTMLQSTSEIAMSSGFVVHLLMKKSELRQDIDVLTSAVTFAVHVFHVLVKEDVPQFQSLPSHLKAGLRKLAFKDSIHETVDNIQEEEAADALCMIFYFSCLNDLGIFSVSDVLYALVTLHTKQTLKCTDQKPVMTRFLLYLMAWSSVQTEEDTEDQTVTEGDLRTEGNLKLNNVEDSVLHHVSELSVDVWATPSPDVFLWLFQTPHRAQGPGAALLEQWLLHSKGAITTESNDSTQTLVFCTLIFCQHFRTVLLGLMVTASEEMSALAKKILMQLITRMTADDQLNAQLVSSIFNEMMSLVQDLFLHSFEQPRHVVNTFLQVMRLLVQHPLYDHVQTDQNQQLRVIYHVVHYISNLGDEDQEVLYNGLAGLHAMSTVTDERQDETIVPILLQNTNFLRHLERSLYTMDDHLCSSALAVTAWIATSCSETANSSPIHITTELILQVLTQRTCDHTAAVLKLLYLSLDSTCQGVTIPVLSFHSSHSVLQTGPFFIAEEIRVLFCHLQQYICSENKEIQVCAVQCYLKLIHHSFELSNTLGENFLHHPWHSHLVYLLLSKGASSGLDVHIADLINKIWIDEDDSDRHTDVARLILGSVLATEINQENQDIFYTLVQKAKALCKDKDLVEKSTCRLASLEESMSSQNAVTPVENTNN